MWLVALEGTTAIQVPDSVLLVPCGVLLVPCGVLLLPCGVLYVPCGVLYVPCGVLLVPCGVPYVPCGVLYICLELLDVAYLYYRMANMLASSSPDLSCESTFATHQPLHPTGTTVRDLLVCCRR